MQQAYDIESPKGSNNLDDFDDTGKKRVTFEVVINDHDVEDLELGDDGEIKEPTMMDWAEALALVDVGCWMKIRVGKAGKDPTQDSFPWYAETETRFVRLLWDLHPSEYRLVSFPHMPKDAYDPAEYMQAKQIMLCDATEVLLEVSPSKSLRLYLAGTEGRVISLVPLPQSRQHAAAWVDALFAGMQLQEMERYTQDSRELLDHRLQPEALREQTQCGVPDDGREIDEEMLMRDEETLADLRLKYYEEHPQEINRHTFGTLDLNSDPEAAHSAAGSKHQSLMGAVRGSARIVLEDIYTHASLGVGSMANGPSKKEEEVYGGAGRGCCVPS